MSQHFTSSPGYKLIPLRDHHARDILTWRYPPPYDFYNPPRDDTGDRYVAAFLNPEFQFHAVVDQDGRMVGFCSFGIDGQVPGGDYDGSALDIGLGMRPELTGNGRGETFVRAILDHAVKAMAVGRVRMTVADFNTRALRVYENLGFTAQAAFSDPLNGVPYTILTRNI